MTEELHEDLSDSERAINLTGKSLCADKLSDAQGTNNPNLICRGMDGMDSELTMTTWEQFLGCNR